MILYSPFIHNNIISKFYLNRRVCTHRLSDRIEWINCKSNSLTGKAYGAPWNDHVGHSTQSAPFLYSFLLYYMVLYLVMFQTFIFPYFSQMYLTITKLSPLVGYWSSLSAQRLFPISCFPESPFPLRKVFKTCHCFCSVSHKRPLFLCVVL